MQKAGTALRSINTLSISWFTHIHSLRHIHSPTHSLTHSLTHAHTHTILSSHTIVTICSMYHWTIGKSSARLNAGSPPRFGSTPCGVLPPGEPYVRRFLPPSLVPQHLLSLYPLPMLYSGRQGTPNRWVEHTHVSTHSLTHSRTHSLTHWHTHSLTHSLTHSHTHTLTHSLTHSITHSFTHSHSYAFVHLHHLHHLLTSLVPPPKQINVKGSTIHSSTQCQAQNAFWAWHLGSCVLLNYRNPLETPRQYHKMKNHKLA